MSLQDANPTPSFGGFGLNSRALDEYMTIRDEHGQLIAEKTPNHGGQHVPVCIPHSSTGRVGGPNEGHYMTL